MKQIRSRKTQATLHKPESQGAMTMSTKIGFIRDEFSRIGCKPKDPWALPPIVCWHYSKVMVRGQHAEVFDYDLLKAVLAIIPDGAGEEFFWRQVAATDFAAMAFRMNRGFEPLLSLVKPRLANIG